MSPVLFSSAARLTVCGRASECLHNEPGWHVHFTALLPHYFVHVAEVRQAEMGTRRAALYA